jgi:DNA-binding MarR family transcriptional regulator
MTIVDVGADREVENALADLQGQLNLIFRRARVLWKESAARLHPDLQVAGYKLLTFIDREGASSAHHLAERFEMDKSVISRQVRMLEDLGLLESRADERDGRLRVLTATSKASTELKRMRHDYAERLRDVIGDLTVDEIASATKVFRQLSEI